MATQTHLGLLAALMQLEHLVVDAGLLLLQRGNVFPDDVEVGLGGAVEKEFTGRSRSQGEVSDKPDLTRNVRIEPRVALPLVHRHCRRAASTAGEQELSRIRIDYKKERTNPPLTLKRSAL